MAVIVPHKREQRDQEAVKDAGFTLVEILCVLALLGLTAGLVVLNLPRPAPAIQTEAQALVIAMNLAARESVIDGRPRAVDLNVGGINLLKYDGAWTSELRRDFSDIRRVELSVEGEKIDFKQRAKALAKAKAKGKDQIPPLIHFDATGNVTPFTLELQGRDVSFVLSPDPKGRIILTPAS